MLFVCLILLTIYIATQTHVKIGHGTYRFKIVLDLCSGLLYLHRDCEKCIVHGDIKPANVMLDASHNAKLGDFGLARLVEHGGEPQTTQVVAGTPGYIDPEFVNNRCLAPSWTCTASASSSWRSPAASGRRRGSRTEPHRC